MKTLIILSLNILVCFALAADKKQIPLEKLKCAGCKTEYYLIQALVKPFAAESSIQLTPAKSGNKIAMQLLLDKKITFAFTCKSLSVLQKSLNLPAEKIQELKCVKIAKDPLVIIVNRKTGITALSKQQLTDLYTHKIRNWKEVGGNDLPVNIACLNPAVETGVNIALNELLQRKNVLISESFFKFDSPRKIGNFISKTPGAMACFALKSYRPRYSTLLNIDATKPSATNIRNGKYPLFINYYLIYNPKGKAGRFVSFISSKKGKEVIDSMMLAEPQQK